MNPFGGGGDEGEGGDMEDIFRGPQIDATTQEGLDYISQEFGYKVKTRTTSANRTLT